MVSAAAVVGYVLAPLGMIEKSVFLIEKARGKAFYSLLHLIGQVGVMLKHPGANQQTHCLVGAFNIGKKGVFLAVKFALFVKLCRIGVIKTAAFLS